MKKLFIILLFTSYSLFGQTLADLKKSDTLYFYFSANDYEKKNIYQNHSINDSLIVYSYHNDTKELISLRYSKYKDFDAQIANITTYKKYHKKHFLKRNKQQFVDIDFMNNLSAKQLYEFIASRRFKTNFIIDEADSKGRKVLVRRTFVNSPYSTDDSEEIIQLYRKRYLKPFYEESGLNDDFFTFIIPKLNMNIDAEDLYILFEPSNFAVKEDTYKYITLRGSKQSEPKIQEQYTFKLNIKKQVVFLQLTHKRKKSQKLEKKYDLFTKTHQTVSFEDLDSFSERQLEDLFSHTRNIYIVENDPTKNYVIPLLVKPTSDWVDFVKNNN